MKGVLMVSSAPVDAESEAEYNAWYGGVHMEEMLTVAGFISARRFRSVDGKGNPYVALYEIEADDLQAALDQALAGEFSRTETLLRDPPPVMSLLQEISAHRSA